MYYMYVSYVDVPYIELMIFYGMHKINPFPTILDDALNILLKTPEKVWLMEVIIHGIQLH